MDRTQRAVMETARMEWEPSPSHGVWRKKLEREGSESGQVTSLVKFEPGAEFSSHGHPRGEEIFVLSGAFEDEHARYPAGTYLRNPPGSHHRPACPGGCEILVKLDQFSPGDLEPVCIETGLADWLPGRVPGLWVMPLHTCEVEHTALVRWEPGTVFSPHVHPGGEEIFVLDGTFEDEDGVYPRGTWLRNPPYSRHAPFSSEGCVILVKTGHMK